MDTLASRETRSLANYRNKELVQKEFSNFIETISNASDSSVKIELLRDFSRVISKYIDPLKFNFPESNGYLRNYLERDASGWEILLICWTKDDITSIHGHPYLCSYNYLQGDFELELFTKVTDTEARLFKKFKVGKDEVFADCGQEDTYCNHIHRIKCISDKGYTLHIYSDDASKGDEFVMV